MKKLLYLFALGTGTYATCPSVEPSCSHIPDPCASCLSGESPQPVACCREGGHFPCLACDLYP